MTVLSQFDTWKNSEKGLGEVATLSQIKAWVLTGPSEEAFEAICGCMERMDSPEDVAAALEFLQRQLVDWPASTCRFRSIHQTHPAWPLVRSLSVRLDTWPWADQEYPQDLYDDACEDGIFDNELFHDLMYEPESAAQVLEAIREVVICHSIKDLELFGVEHMVLPSSWLSTMPHLCSLLLAGFYFPEPLPPTPALKHLHLLDVTMDEPSSSFLSAQTSLQSLILEAESSLGGALSVKALSQLQALTVHRVRPLDFEKVRNLRSLVWWHVPPDEGFWLDEESLAKMTALERLEWKGPGLTPDLDGLRHLKKLQGLKLESMSLESLSVLKEHPELEFLDLSGLVGTNFLRKHPGDVSALLQEKDNVLSSRGDVQLLQAFLLQAEEHRSQPID